MAKASKLIEPTDKQKADAKANKLPSPAPVPMLTVDNSKWTKVRIMLHQLDKKKGGMEIMVSMALSPIKLPFGATFQPNWKRLTYFKETDGLVPIRNREDTQNVNVPSAGQLRRHGDIALQSHGPHDVTAFRDIRWSEVTREELEEERENFPASKK